MKLYVQIGFVQKKTQKQHFRCPKLPGVRLDPWPFLKVLWLPWSRYMGWGLVIPPVLGILLSIMKWSILGHKTHNIKSNFSPWHIVKSKRSCLIRPCFARNWTCVQMMDVASVGNVLGTLAVMIGCDVPPACENGQVRVHSLKYVHLKIWKGDMMSHRSHFD